MFLDDGSRDPSHGAVILACRASGQGQNKVNKFLLAGNWIVRLLHGEDSQSKQRVQQHLGLSECHIVRRVVAADEILEDSCQVRVNGDRDDLAGREQLCSGCPGRKQKQRPVSFEWNLIRPSGGLFKVKGERLVARRLEDNLKKLLIIETKISR